MRNWINLFEMMEDWSGVFKHYSDSPMLTTNISKKTHQDPVGIYFFPEEFKPFPYWESKKYIFKAKLKPGARVLDFANISEGQIRELVDAVGATEQFEQYIKNYPPENTIKMLDQAWEMMRMKMMSDTGKWNAILRHMGWDAIFDDTKAVHSEEPQLIVLNPSIIEIISRESPKPEVYRKIEKIIEDIKNVDWDGLKVYMIEKPKTKNKYGHKFISAAVVIAGDDYNPEIYDYKVRNAWIEIKYDPRDTKEYIQIYLKYSTPSLGYGCGTHFHIRNEEYSDGFDRFIRDVKRVFEIDA